MFDGAESNKGGRDKDVNWFPTNKDIINKLNIMSGVINTIEGIVKKIFNRLDTISFSLTGLKVIHDKLNEVLKRLEPNKSSFHFSSIKYGNTNIKIIGRIERFTMNEFQFVEVTLEGTKKNGSPADWDGDPTVETDHPELVTAEVIDHKTLRFTGIEDVATAPVAINCTAKVDADLGDGVEEQTATGILVFEPGRLSGLTMRFGEPQDKA